MQLPFSSVFIGAGKQLEGLEAFAQSKGQSTGLLHWTEGLTPAVPDAEVWVVDQLSAAEEEAVKAAAAQGQRILSPQGFVRQLSANKQRILIAGTTNKKAVLGMVLTALRHAGRAVDYVLPMPVEGIENMVSITNAPVIIMQGSDIPASPVDDRPAFMDFEHHIAVITGVTWEHALQYPTQEAYVRQFDELADATPKAGSLLYNEEDSLASMICQKEREDVATIAYSSHPYRVEDGKCMVPTHTGQEVQAGVFGAYNMSNLAAAKGLCQRIGLSEEQFYAAVPHMSEAPIGLKQLGNRQDRKVYMASGFSPTAVHDYVAAVKEVHPNMHIVAALEIPLDMGLNRDFLQHYNRTLKTAEEALLYVGHSEIKKSGLDDLQTEDFRAAFDRQDLEVFHEIEPFISHLIAQSWDNKALVLLWTSPYMDALIQRLSDKIL